MCMVARLSDAKARQDYDILIKRQQLIMVPFGGPSDDIGVIIPNADNTTAPPAEVWPKLKCFCDFKQTGPIGGEDSEDDSTESHDYSDVNSVDYSDSGSDADEYHGQGQVTRKQESWKSIASSKKQQRSQKSPFAAKLSPRVLKLTYYSKDSHFAEKANMECRCPP